MITRRRFLKLTTAAGGGVFLYSKLGFPTSTFAAIPGGTLPPGTIQKYKMPLTILPAMPRTAKIEQDGKSIDYYEIAVRQFRQQVLPTGMPRTTVWSYGSVKHESSFNYPAFTIEAKRHNPVRVKWINDLKDPETGKFLPHLLPVDPTLHWANPPGGVNGRDRRPTFTSTPGPYKGPVPFVTHLHGGHTSPESDGYAEAWFLPAASNIPKSFATVGSEYAPFKAQFKNKTGITWTPGTAVFQYANDQRETTLWYHDHTLGMTRLNVYAGPVGFYLLRGEAAHDNDDDNNNVRGTLPGPAPALDDPRGTKYYEIPIVIQDRSFNADGSLFYPSSRDFFDGFAGPYVPKSDISPMWNPEFFGNTMVVNGRTWPYLKVEARRYRLRLLNACNSRFVILQFSDPALSFWQIGGDGGFLSAPVPLSQLLLGPSERADVIVDFSVLPSGAEVILQNLAPDEPFGGGAPGVDFEPADPATTGQVMQFRVVPPTTVDKSTPPALLGLPTPPALGPARNTRQVSLNEEDSAVLSGVGPRDALLGTVSGGVANPLPWMDSITENPALGATEIWEIHNFTEDAHPIHIHLVQFEVVNRQAFGGVARPAENNETGGKDTVIAYPGEITRVKATFDIPGLYVWHCHILEHEDNEMMRPYFIGPMKP